MLKRLGDDVERELARHGAPAGIGRVVDAWEAAVGETIARNAWPARIARDGTLHVHTSSSSWAFELTHLEERIREGLGEAAPAKVRFAPGPLPERTPDPATRAARAPVAPTAEHEAQAADLVAEIGDEELREKVQRAAALSLAKAAADRAF